MMSKKAQSEIITTVLIILLVLAAIVIVWQVVNSTVSKGATGINTGTACIEVGLDIVKANNKTNEVTITRRAGGADDAMKNVTILVDGTNKGLTAPADSQLAPLETGVWNVTGGFGLDKKIEVAVVLKDGTVCDVSDSIQSTGA